MDSLYLLPTKMIDSDHPRVREYAESIVGVAPLGATRTAVRLYNAVRDDIRYSPYSPFYRPAHFRASNVIRNRVGYCVSKASLLCALGRACNIPARVGFATVRNHIATRQLLDLMGSDIFVYHGYTEFWLDGRWVKATPAFDRRTCKRHGIRPLAFNGRVDSILHAYNEKKQLFMEYIENHGQFSDIPVGRIVAAYRKAYGTERVESWIERLESLRGWRELEFETETVVA